MNSFLRDSSPFQPRSQYKICNTLSRILNNKTPYSEPPKQSKKKNIEPPVIRSRSERVERRNKINDELLNSDSLISETIPSPSINVVGDETVVEAEKKKRRSFFDVIAEFSKKFHKPFKNLKWRKRVERLDDISAMIIAAAIEKSRFTAEGKSYCIGNDELGHEVLNILNCIEIDLKIN